MPRMGIDFKQVAKAADELVNDGKQPTIRLIRALLGTGSPNTIQRHLTQWFDARAQAIDAELPALITTSQTLESECDALASEASQQTENFAKQVTCTEPDQHAIEAIRIELATALLKIEAQAEKLNELTQENQRLRAILETRESAQQIAGQKYAELHKGQNPASKVYTYEMENRSPVGISGLQQAQIELMEDRQKNWRLANKLDRLWAEVKACEAEMGFGDGYEKSYEKLDKALEEWKELRRARDLEKSKSVSEEK